MTSIKRSSLLRANLMRGIAAAHAECTSWFSQGAALRLLPSRNSAETGLTKTSSHRHLPVGRKRHAPVFSFAFSYLHSSPLWAFPCS